MLFLLTGDIQIGKTRWLQSLEETLESEGVNCYGVIAPGVWKESVSADGALSYEKLGINNLLLPQKEIVHFAVREDIAKRSGGYDGSSQAAQAKLAWHISDDAINKVNAHLLSLLESFHDGEIASRGMLIIDELGRLELLHGTGLTEAVRLLDAGPNRLVQNAILIVRNTLSDIAEERFSKTWGGSIRISPDEFSRSLVLDAAC